MFGRKKPVKQDDGWEKTDTLRGALFFLHTQHFDVCVWKGDFTEELMVDGERKVRWLGDTWGLSCHRALSFSAALPDAKGERTAKLMALEAVVKRTRKASYDAAVATKKTADIWAKRDGFRPLREMPIGRPSKEPCEECGATPTIPLTKLCGPCTFGDPSTAGGNW